MMQRVYGFSPADLGNASMTDLRSFVNNADFLQANGVTKEQIAKKAPSLLELADAMYRLIMDPQVPRSELRMVAEPYGKARGL